MKAKTDVLVVGGGPIGMFSAISLARRGLDVVVVDSQPQGAVHSRGLALHPQTLRLLDEIGVSAELVSQGHRVDSIAFYDGDKRKAEIDVSAVGGTFPFVLVVSQSMLETALERVLCQHRVKLLRNHEALSIEAHRDSVVADVARMEKVSLGYSVMRTEWEIDKTFPVEAQYVIGADGRESRMRSIVSQANTLGPTERFAIFEFVAPLEVQHEVRVVFSGGSSNVLWPIGTERGRWSFERTEALPKQAEEQLLRSLADMRAPWFRAQPLEIHWSARVHFDRLLVSSMGRGRNWLVGDAAHATSPIGVQSMNIGFREAHDLAERLSAISHGGAGPELLSDYDAMWRARWMQLLGAPAQFDQSPGSWAGAQAQRIVSSIPASGQDLDRLLAQLGMRLGPAPEQGQHAVS